MNTQELDHFPSSLFIFSWRWMIFKYCSSYYYALVLLPSVIGWFTLADSEHEKINHFHFLTWQRQNFGLLSIIYIIIQCFPLCGIRINVRANAILFGWSSLLQGFSFCYWAVLNSLIPFDVKKLCKVCRSAHQPRLREFFCRFWAD